MNKKNEKLIRGQALLVVLLSLSVVLIIVLYIVSRSITDISLSTKDEEALRAFSAAEAGIERALIIGSDTGNVTVGDASFNAKISSFAQGETEVTYPIALKSGQSATFWFARPNEPDFTGDQMKICWGNSGSPNGDSQTPALELTIVYAVSPNDLSTLRIARATLDPNSARILQNNFNSAQTTGCSVGGEDFQFFSNISFSSFTGQLQYAKARLVYNTDATHKVGIDVSASGSVLPSQGFLVDSQGSFGSANRRIELYELHPVAPPIFENVIFSSGGITK